MWVFFFVDSKWSDEIEKEGEAKRMIAVHIKHTGMALSSVCLCFCVYVCALPCKLFSLFDYYRCQCARCIIPIWYLLYDFPSRSLCMAIAFSWVYSKCFHTRKMIIRNSNLEQINGNLWTQQKNACDNDNRAICVRLIVSWCRWCVFSYEASLTKYCNTKSIKHNSGSSKETINLK